MLSTRVEVGHAASSPGAPADLVLPPLLLQQGSAAAPAPALLLAAADAVLERCVLAVVAAELGGAVCAL